MRVLYSDNGIPFILQDDDSILDFSKDAQRIIGELSTSQDLLTDILTNIKTKIDEMYQSYSLMNKDEFVNMKTSVETLKPIQDFAGIIETCNNAEGIYYKLITEKPYSNWVWNDTERNWKPPYPIPYGEDGDKYYWDDEHTSWNPVEKEPGVGWEWSYETHSWKPPIPYPIDAQPGEFVWSNSLENWVLAN